MSFVTRVIGDAHIIEARGRITIGNDALLRDAVQTAVARGSRSIIIDAQNVTVLDSSGAGELVAAHLLLRDLGGRLVLARIAPKAGGVLLATRLTGVLEIHDSLEGALLALDDLAA